MRVFHLSLITGFFTVMVLAILAMDAYWLNVQEPEPQPINFPHDKHAGKLNIPCAQCHVYADKARFATVPAMKICVDCHITGGVKSPEIDKLMAYWERQEPVPWVRIHKVKPFVYFSHKRHVKKGIDCSVCHGDMKVVQTVKQVRTLQMGFCVSCHQANSAPLDCWTCHK